MKLSVSIIDASRPEPKSNSIIGARIPVTPPDFTVEEDFTFYDLLPVALRYAIREVAVHSSAKSVFNLMHKRSMTFTLWALGDREGQEIRSFAAYYKKNTGYTYPFLAADASIQRYNSGHIQKRTRRYYRQAWFDGDIMKVPDGPRRRRHVGRR